MTAFKEQLNLSGHAGWVVSVGWSPDGTRLASASNDATVRVWDAGSGAQVAVLSGHTDSVRSVGWSPDGTRLASASRDGTVRVWDVVSGGEVAVLSGHTGGALSVGWSPDGTRLASASNDATVRVWDVVSGGEVAVLSGHTGGVLSVGWSPDGTRLASAGIVGKVRVWDVGSGVELAVLSGHTNSVRSVGWSPDGTRLASASSDNTVRVWADGQEPTDENATVDPALITDLVDLEFVEGVGVAGAAELRRWLEPFVGYVDTQMQDGVFEADEAVERRVERDLRYLREELFESDPTEDLNTAIVVPMAQRLMAAVTPSLPPDEGKELVESITAKPSADPHDPVPVTDAVQAVSEQVDLSLLDDEQRAAAGTMTNQQWTVEQLGWGLGVAGSVATLISALAVPGFGPVGIVLGAALGIISVAYRNKKRGG